jgi:hypothetical protein
MYYADLTFGPWFFNAGSWDYSSREGLLLHFTA